MNISTSRSSKIGARHALAVIAIAGALAMGSVQARDTSLPDTPGGQLYVSPSQVRLVQEKLRDQGRTTQVDGVWGDQTTAEVRAFQRANGLAPTGQLDTSLLSALDIGDVLEGETSSGFLDGLLRTEKAAIQATSGQGAALYVSPVHVAQIQHVLQTKGFYSGRIDGMWGPNTAHAADKYRAEHGLEANPGLDIAARFEPAGHGRSETPHECHDPDSGRAAFCWHRGDPCVATRARSEGP